TQIDTFRHNQVAVTLKGTFVKIKKAQSTCQGLWKPLFHGAPQLEVSRSTDLQGKEKKKTTYFVEGRATGNMEDQINRLIRKMNQGVYRDCFCD
ncbi:hypothetical protein J0S82_011064, partial [Galemys pyrenaicus]